MSSRRSSASAAVSASTHRKARFEHLEPRQLLAATPIEVRAAGDTGEERMELRIDGQAVQVWENVGGDYSTRQFVSFEYVHPDTVTADRIRVAFVNDGLTAGGEDRNLRVDGITVAGEVFESEAASVRSTGSHNAATGCAPGYKQSETLACNGNFRYAPASDTIQIRAAGATGEETMELRIDGVVVQTWNNIGGDAATRQFVGYDYVHPAEVTLDQISVAFVNEGQSAAGESRALRVNRILLGGVRYESEASTVLTTVDTTGGTPWRSNFNETEMLNANGSFIYAPIDATAISIRAAGATGEERMALQIDGETVREWGNFQGNARLREFVTFNYVHPTQVTADRIRVAFINDGRTATGADKNLDVDGITVAGVVYESEASSVFSTGVWDSATGCAPGFKQSERLHCNGYLAFESPPQNPGVIGIGQTQYLVAEPDGTATVTFVRTDGSEGVATVDYTTVPGTAVAGQDYISRSGTVIFADGQTEQSVNITILDDGLGEGTEAFNLAIDRVTGATAGQPRTTTISIFDDEQPSPGDGIGLKGEYFNGRTLTDLLLTRTDTTVNFNWGRSAPASTVPGDNFSIRWTGEVQPLYSEVYTFLVTADDGVRLWVNDQLLVDQWIDQNVTTYSGFITLSAGVRYSLRMEYYENGGDAVAQLSWASPRQAQQVIPTSQLYSEQVIPTDGAFSGEDVITGLNQPTAIEFAPTGQMFIAQKDGLVRVSENGQLLPTPFIDLRNEVNNIQDRGLLELELDPDFLATPWVYLLYTYDPVETLSRSGLAGPDGAGNRVSRLIRVLADANNGYRTIVPGSTQIILGENSTWANIPDPDQDGTNNVNLPATCAGLEDCIPVDSRSHSIGALGFAPDGSLFVTNGDGTSFGRVDPRSARVQDLDSLAGKVLRIDPDTGEGISNNPFYEPSNPDSNRSKVYHYGLRNPFRMAIHPTTGEPYVSDVGWNTWEEINTGTGVAGQRSGKNFGWPWYEGGAGANQQTGGYRDLSEAQVFYANNNATPPLWSRSHSDGGVAAIIGDFYTGTLYPAQYQGTAFFTDFGDPTIRALRVTDNGELLQTLVVTGGVGTVVEMTMGPDGMMYYADIGAGKIGRLRFNASASALAPVAASFAALPSTPTGSAESGYIEEPLSNTGELASDLALFELNQSPAAGAQVTLLADESLAQDPAAEQDQEAVDLALADAIAVP